MLWLKNIFQLEHGQKLLKCQEKPDSVHKMQKKRLAASAGGAYSAPQTL